MRNLSSDSFPSPLRRRVDRPAVGDKQPLTPSVRKELLRHLPYLAGRNLDAYTFEVHSSHFANARWDIFVFDDEGRPVIQGRDFHGGPTAFWPLLNTFTSSGQRTPTTHQGPAAVRPRA